MKLNNPCIGVCKFDAATGLCKACFRTRDERKTWKGVSDESRNAIIALRPEREQALIAAGTALTAPKSKKSEKDTKKKDVKDKKDRKDKKDKKKAEKKRKKKNKKAKN